MADAAGTVQRKLGSIVRIDSVEDHPDADKLAVATVKGWRVVTSKERDNYKAGDLAIYMEIDTVVPEELLEGRAEHAILAKKNFTIKTAKIRGVVSQGILFTLDLLERAPEACGKACQEGDDVTAALGLTKREEPAPEGSGPFPAGVPRTDEERVQNLTGLLADLEGVKLYVTEKVDGASFTAVYEGGELQVASRNQSLHGDSNNWARAAAKMKLRERMEAAGLDGVVLQGELLGPKIQGNRYKLKDLEVLFFSVFDRKKNEYLPFLEAREAVEGKLGLKFVPVVHEEYFLPKDTKMDALIESADGRSALNPQAWREGLVFRSIDESRRPTKDGRLSFKVISNKYLLKYDS